MHDGCHTSTDNSESTEKISEVTDKMRMADGSTILRRNRQGTKSKVINNKNTIRYTIRAANIDLFMGQTFPLIWALLTTKTKNCYDNIVMNSSII